MGFPKPVDARLTAPLSLPAPVTVEGTLAVTGAASAASLATSPAAVAQPAVPATAVALANPTGVDCTVYVAGGTITVIAINGTATGLIAGTFHLAANATITLTYTVAPTTFLWEPA